MNDNREIVESDDVIIKRLSSIDVSVYDHYTPINLKHYNVTQIKWISDARFLDGINNGHNPSEIEVCSSLEKYSTPQRFRAFYALKYPQFVEYSD